MQNNSYISNNFQNNNDRLNIRVEIEKYLRWWKWFVVAGILSLVLAFLYLRYSTPKYKAVTTILIKDNKKSGISAEFEAFKDLGIIGGGSSNNPDNEIEILKSRRIIKNVVDKLDLDVFYYVSGRVKETEVYKNSSPIKINFIKKDSALNAKDTLFNVKLLNDFEYELLNTEEQSISTHKFGEEVKNSLGVFEIFKRDVKNKEFSKKVIVRILPKYSVVSSYRNRLAISPVNNKSSVLTLTLIDAVKEKAKDVLDQLIEQYNLDAVNDKNQVAQKTNKFIENRLDTIGKQLAAIEDRVKKYKVSKNFTGLPVESQISFEVLKESNQKIINIKTQISIALGVEDMLTKESSKDDLLPETLGIDDISITQLIVKYNDLVLRRNFAKESGAGIKNPLLVQLESQLASHKSNLIKGLSNVSNSLNLQLEEANKEAKEVISKVKSIPDTERGYVDIARDREIIVGLYQYLLKKKEETDISLAVTVSNAKIIDIAYSSNAPVSPKKKIIYLAAFFIGILIPFALIYILDLLDTKVHTKKDIESELSVPFLGDIPKSDSKEKIIIGNDVRSSTAEAFRLIRTNLDFMLASNRKQSKAIFITSTTSGEGKSFISINIAATLALSGKKVLLMGMDLRAPKVTEYLGIPDRKGVTNYITDDELSLEEITFTIPQVKGLDIIASGVIPPNPAELLMTKRIDNLFTIVKQEYDIVIVDTAPVNLVTDTLLIGKYADMFMYVVRANYLDKRLLQVPQELYNEKKLPNMAIVLNDTDPKRSYGYGYGGYGYGYVVVEKPWYKKIFSRD